MVYDRLLTVNLFSKVRGFGGLGETFARESDSNGVHRGAVPINADHDGFMLRYRVTLASLLRSNIHETSSHAKNQR